MINRDTFTISRSPGHVRILFHDDATVHGMNQFTDAEWSDIIKNEQRLGGLHARELYELTLRTTLLPDGRPMPSDIIGIIMATKYGKD